ncbi:MAG TPA: hypothetical protein VHB68_06065 [Steroidobacteraceae bacterium]|nr:hypothetical protein [Steroidobacteraceae bacterium]
MNVDPKEAPREDVPAETATAAPELVEVGTVSATQGSVFGTKPDNGVGLIFG